jgi:hypothetical protein
MNAAKSIAVSIHDTIADVTTAVEDIHRSIAEFPLASLESIEPLQKPVKEVRAVHARSIGTVYGLVHRINDRVGQIAAEVLE